MIGTSQLEAMAAFYKNVFGKKADMEDGGYFGWQVGNSFFTVGEHSEVHGKSKEPQRIILNLETKDVREEFKRIQVIEGVTVVKEPYEMEGWEGGWIATLADPDGNYLQLMTPWDKN